MDNISILNKDNCTGCRMCEQICPVKAIVMKENEEGFIEPVINEEKCVHCGLCAKRCPQLNAVKIERVSEPRVYAAKSINKEEQKQSSSGGIFSVLAKHILNKDGIVYGCAFNENFVAEHIGIDEKEQLYRLRGSKYVQSNTKNTFNEVKQNLEKGKKVLYSGTPCQIAGLKSFLAKEYENLITIDLLCHGVPSPRLFSKYKEYIENKNKVKIEKFEFRNKERGYWTLGYKIKVTLKNKVKFINGDEDIYTNAFSKGITLREVCYSCKYTNNKRMGDITLGDFWGIDKEYPKLYDKNGVSVVLVNSAKGERILKEIKSDIMLEEVEYEKVEKYADTLKSSCKRNEERDHIYKSIEEHGIEKTLKNEISLKSKIKKYVPSIIRLKVRELKK